MPDTAQLDRFLADSVRALRRGAPLPVYPDRLPDEEALWLRIEYHGIALLLVEEGERLADWPATMRTRIAEEARLMSLWEATHRPLIAELVEELADKRIESVFLKGTALAYWLHDDPAIRRRGDSDLLIRAQDRAAARIILARRGWYRRSDPHGLYAQEGWLHDAAQVFVHLVDLHWEPSDRPVLRDLLPIEAIFCGSAPLPRLSARARRPEAAMLLIHEAVNQKWHAHHGYFTDAGRMRGARRLIWSLDFALLVEAMEESDWQSLISRCDEERAGPIVAQALRGAVSDLSFALPEGVLERLEAHDIHPDLARYFTGTDTFSEFWLDLKTASGWRERARFILRRALPPRRHLMAKYPGMVRWPTALLRSRMLAETAGRLALRAVRR